jgi:hypothetical protein
MNISLILKYFQIYLNIIKLFFLPYFFAKKEKIKTLHNSKIYYYKFLKAS